MQFQSAGYLSPSKQMPKVQNEGAYWDEIRKGLGGVLLGYFVLLAGGALGLGFHHLAYDGYWAVRMVEFRGDSADLFLPLAGGTICLAILLATALVVRGLWRCLMHSPSVQNGKELIYAGFLSVATSLLTGMAGLYLSGRRTYGLLVNGTHWLDAVNLTDTGCLLLLASVTLAVLSCVIFTQYVGSVAGSVQDRARVVGCERNLLFIGLLMGATVGTLMSHRHLAIVNELLPWVGACWVLWFVWHVWLVDRLRGHLAATRDHADERRQVVARPDAGAVSLRSLSGLRRLANGSQG